MTAGPSLWLDALGLEVRFRDVSGIRTRCLEAGDGPPAIVMHGIEASAENHVRNLAALGTRRRVVAPDLLGHGLTDKPDGGYDIADYGRHVLALMDALGIERADLVGQSLGGWIACWLALEAPDRVGALVLNTMAGLPVAGADGWEAFAGLVARSAQAVESLDRALIRRRLEWVVADATTVTDELVELRRRLWDQPGWQRIAGRVVTLLTPERYVPQQIDEAALARIEAPVLVLWTRANPVHGLDAAERAVAALPRGRLAIVEDAGHWPQFEQPDAFNAAVLDFLPDPSTTGGGSRTASRGEARNTTTAA
ncbi:2-hydroxymuconate semialdehyde hydrolase [Baekduia alba]|uniref:alpha/beta fold hydrolase n=1 Tax=Baekduia alba TaxID=2997333 RepID=UPI0023413F06|nr:alpha/beta hydrolase [Baekduia alba]WCB96690.1 2-hydroxymuconate semialdehyde hydrolase [Baekduia alba]